MATAGSRAQTSIQSLEKEMGVLRKREEMARKEADTSAREKGLQLQVRALALLCTGLDCCSCFCGVLLLLFVLQPLRVLCYVMVK